MIKVKQTRSTSSNDVRKDKIENSREPNILLFTVCYDKNDIYIPTKCINLPHCIKNAVSSSSHCNLTSSNHKVLLF